MKLRKLLEEKSKFQKLKDNKVELTPEERAEVMKRKAVWHFHFGRDGKRKTTPAVWKSINPKTKETTYITNTHRAAATGKTLKSMINKYHSLIKGTAK